MTETKTKVSAREKLLDAAIVLIMQRGYPSAAVDDVCRAAGVSKGSFYHHFKSKEDLALHVLDSQVTGACEVIENGPWQKVEDPVQRALAFVDHVAEKAEGLWGKGCVIGVLAMDLSGFGTDLKAAVLHVFEMLEKNFTPMFAPIAQLNGESRPTADALARQFVRVIEGGAVLSRSTGNAAPVREALESFRHYLGLLTK